MRQKKLPQKVRSRRVRIAIDEDAELKADLAAYRKAKKQDLGKPTIEINALIKKLGF